MQASDHGGRWQRDVPSVVRKPPAGTDRRGPRMQQPMNAAGGRVVARIQSNNPPSIDAKSTELHPLVKEEHIMTRTFVRRLMVFTAIWMAGFATLALAVDQGTVISERVKKLTRAVKWNQVAAIPIAFNTYHPQGMVKIGDTYFVSTVDIRKQTTRYPQLQDGYDRD